MKRGAFVFGILLITLSAGLISAQELSLSNLLGSIEPTMIILGVIWIVSFALIYFSLNKLILKGQPGISAVVAFALSLLITWGYNQTNWNVQNIFFPSGISLSPDFLYTIVPIALLVVIAVLFFTLKANAFFVLGGILLVAGFLGWVYEKTLLIILGLILVVVGAGFAWKKYKKSKKKTILESLLKK